MNEQPSAEWLTVAQAAARLGVNVRTVRRRCERGNLVAELRTTDTGHAWFIDPASLEAVSDPHTSATSDLNRPRSVNLGQDKASDRTEKMPDMSDGSDKIGQISDTRMARLEGYAARDLEMVIASALREAVTPLVERIDAMTTQSEGLIEEIKQLSAVQATQVAENAALRLEVELMAAAQMAAQLTATSTEGAPEDTHEPPEAAIEEALDKSLKQVQEMSDEVDLLQAENERLKFELEKTRRPWWQRFFFDP